MKIYRSGALIYIWHYKPDEWQTIFKACQPYGELYLPDFEKRSFMLAVDDFYNMDNVIRIESELRKTLIL